MTCNCQQQTTMPPAPTPCSCKGSAPQPCGSTTTIHTPNPCHTAPSSYPTHDVRLYTLRCGTWVYAGQMSLNSPPMVNTRIMWENKAYTITQATLVGTEPGKDKWEVMLVTAAGPHYEGGSRQPCTPCQPPVLPPLDPPGGIYVDNPTCGQPVTYPITNHPYTPLPVEQGLGCGPQYTCTGYPG